MADEPNAVPEGDDELILAPEDQLVEDKQADPIAELATEMGWAPKDKFKGDPEKWREPADFIRAGGDIQRSTAKELKAMRSTVDTIAKTSANLMNQRIEEERAKLTEQYNAAVEDGDSNRSFKIAQDITKLETAPTNEAPAEARDFAEANSKWFNKDPLATKRAVEVTEAYHKAGASVAEQLAAAERVIRKEYPEHFVQPKKPAAVNNPSRSGGGNSGKRGFVDLPAEAQKVARRFLEDSSIPLETYATNYFASERKVG